MKKVIGIYLLFLYFPTFAQSKGIAYYGYIEFGSKNKGIDLDYNAYLLFNKEKAYYVTSKDSLEKEENINKTKISSTDKSGVIALGMSVSTQGEQVFTSLKGKTMWSNIFWEDHIYVKEPIPVQNWKIINETKKFGKFTCKKATSTFRGRDYTAWFTSEIPVSFGPWKFNGLPGIILEVYDTDKDFHWYFKSLEYPTKNAEEITFIKKGKYDKPIKFIDLIQFQQVKINLRNKKIENNRMLNKKLQGVIINDPEISDMFVEF